ncbi:MAG: hypothetical protein M3O46_03645, partial [Myxococcota bacterium]|nr:hypothetical protein [Myxococcota bacterium]
RQVDAIVDGGVAFCRSRGSSLMNLRHLVGSAVIVSALAIVTDGCSSSSSSDDAGADATGEASHPPSRIDGSAFDAGVGPGDSGGGDASVPAHDGTSGKQCMSNADCKGTGANAQGINVCSNTYTRLQTFHGVTTPQFWPTPICMTPLPTAQGVGNCDPGPSGVLQFCDSDDPNSTTSPGICLPLTTPQQAGPMNGYCLPACSFALDGSRPTGCPGKDTCTPYTILLSGTTSAVTGFGFCQGTCEVDADCSALGAGWVCQTDEGFCTKTKKVRTKAIGSACTNGGNGATPLATSDSQLGTCNCPFTGATTTAFYCTSACVVGGAACPNGWTCDAFQQSTFTFTGAADGGGDIVLPGPTMQNVGLPGLCMAPCANPDGGTPDAAGVPDTGAGDATSADTGVADAGAGDAGVAETGSPDAGAGMATGPMQCPGSMNVPPLSTCRVPSDTNGTVAGPDCVP